MTLASGRRVMSALRCALPAATGTPVFLTDAQTQKAKDYLTAHWAKAIG